MPLLGSDTADMGYSDLSFALETGAGEVHSPLNPGFPGADRPIIFERRPPPVPEPVPPAETVPAKSLRPDQSPYEKSRRAWRYRDRVPSAPTLPAGSDADTSHCRSRRASRRAE